MNRLDPRVVIVSGGSRGLGAGLVKSFLESGDYVATCARSSTDLMQQLQTDPATRDRFLFRPVDVSVSAAVDRFMAEVVQTWGGIDVLVNNAGLAREGVIALFGDDDVDSVVDLNLKGTVYMTRAASRRMLLRGGGSIVNISSIIGISGYRGLSVYGATKAALDALTRALARELGSKAINVNSVAPGYLETEMSHGLDEDQLRQIVRRTPAGRLGTPHDVARAVQFLAYPDSRFISGVVLVVDGGLTS